MMKIACGACIVFVMVIVSLSFTCIAASENSASGRSKSQIQRYYDMQQCLFIIILLHDIVLLYGPTDYHHDCKEVMDKMSGEPYSGIYTIKPDHLPPFDVCLVSLCICIHIAAC